MEQTKLFEPTLCIARGKVQPSQEDWAMYLTPKVWNAKSPQEKTELIEETLKAHGVFCTWRLDINEQPESINFD